MIWGIDTETEDTILVLKSGSASEFLDEKRSVSEDFEEPIIDRHTLYNRRKRDAYRQTSRVYLFLGCIVFLLFVIQALYGMDMFKFCSRDATRLGPVLRYEAKKYVNNGIGDSRNNSNGPVALGVAHGPSHYPIISVSSPYVPDSSYGEPVYSTLVIDHTFGNSYGSPALQSYNPPNVTFNRVVLTLNTSISGSQYDRLGHIYLGGSEIWRTSTIEPGGNSVFSTAVKDVSSYLKLWRSPNDILFVLNNIVTDKLNGQFHTQLYADFYYTDAPFVPQDDISYDVISSADARYSILSWNKAADQIYPLVKTSTPDQQPVISFPNDDFVVTLPNVTSNTTRLKLAIFASGNADEEFWYNNVLDEYSGKFGNGAHGPARFINVFFNGRKVATQTIKPVIFTGGISPSFWSPIVSNNAFDLESYDVDLTGLLPYLWSGNSTAELKIEISNGLDEISGKSSGVGQNWFIGANLLAYESGEVTDSYGELVSIVCQESGNAFSFDSPDNTTLNQIVNSILTTDVSSTLQFELKSNRTLDTTFKILTKADVSNIQNYANSGALSKVVHVGHNSKSLHVIDNSLGADRNVIQQQNVTLSYSLVSVSNLKDVKDNNNYRLDSAIVNVKGVDVKANGDHVLSELAAQNGTADFVVSSSGNHGSGNLTTNYRLDTEAPFAVHDYEREVVGQNNAIISDYATENGSSINEEWNDLDFTQDRLDESSDEDYILSDVKLAQSAGFDFTGMVQPILDTVFASNLTAVCSGNSKSEN